MSAEKLDLVALRRPVAVVFPNGTEHAVAPFRLDGHLLLKRFQVTPDDAALLMDLLRLAVPDATDEDFNTLSLDEDVPRVLGVASGKIALVEAALKNGLSGAGAEEAPSPPSSLTTVTSTS
jgi:hypothetical protein